MSMQEIPIENIYVSETASQNARRKQLTDDNLAELTESIRAHGVLQPIIVRPREMNGYTHELVAGERRFLAADKAGLPAIPAMVRELSDEQVIEVQLIENLQRHDLHPMQEAEGYQELMKKHGHPVDELHARVGKSRSYVYGRLKLLALCKKAREAFYANQISASVALIVARIPSDKLQESALTALVDPDGQLSARSASKIVRDRFMLRLKDAKFPKDDPEINGDAGPCHACPKRTGNQAELFADVDSADVCTDPVCFRAKAVAFGARRIREANEAGKPVLAGKAAKKLISHGQLQTYRSGYKAMDESNYDDPRYRKNRAIVGKDAEVTLLQHPTTGEIIELVKESDVKAALKKIKANRPTSPDPYAAQKKKAKIEKQFRAALFERVRPLLPAPSFRELAAFAYQEMDHERRKTVAKIRGIEPVKRKQYGSTFLEFDEAVQSHLAGLDDAGCLSFIIDCMYVGELQVSTYGSGKGERLLAAAKAAGIDVNEIRKQVTPKPPKKKGKKKAAKKASKKAAKKTVTVNCLHCGAELIGKRPGAKYCDSLHAALAKKAPKDA